MAQGLLTDRYIDGIPADSHVRADGRYFKESSITEKRIEQVKALNELAKQRCQSLAQMALAWVLRDGIVTSVFIGASKPQQILDDLGALKNTTFSSEELKIIDEISLR